MAIEVWVGFGTDHKNGETLNIYITDNNNNDQN